MSDDNSNAGCGMGCGCFPLIAGILLWWAWWFGLPTPWGVFHIDIFPPAIDLIVPDGEGEQTS